MEEWFLKLTKAKMPFGKYANRRLVEIPEEYFLWFAQKGFPAGELGKLMEMMLELKINGLEYLIHEFPDQPTKDD